MKSFLGTPNISEIIYAITYDNLHKEIYEVYFRMKNTISTDTAVIIPLPSSIENIDSISETEGNAFISQFREYGRNIRNYVTGEEEGDAEDDLKQNEFRVLRPGVEFRGSNAKAVGRFTAIDYPVKGYAKDFADDDSSNFLNIQFLSSEAGYYGVRFTCDNTIDLPEMFQLIAAPGVSTFILYPIASKHFTTEALPNDLNAIGFKRIETDFVKKTHDLYNVKMVRGDTQAIVASFETRNKIYTCVGVSGNIDERISML